MPLSETRQDVLLVTGGAGFIGSAFVRRLIGRGRRVAVLDALTYAGRLENLVSVASNSLFSFHKCDICDAASVRALCDELRPTHIVHFAAESHVDRSIEEPGKFVTTNVIGTQVMLDTALSLQARFVHVSTDEVFGTLGHHGKFNEATSYDPRSPYSASKAASDHLARAWHESYGLDVVITNCTNNYGPHQFPEKLVPHMIISALEGRDLPIYGKGDNVRDWLHVDDHVEAIEMVMDRGVTGRTYCIGGEAERTNLEVVNYLVELLDQHAPREDKSSHAEAITYVQDRPGHDLRYAMDISRIRGELGWTPTHSFQSGMESTVLWYLDNRQWWDLIRSEGEGARRIGLTKKGHDA